MRSTLGYVVCFALLVSMGCGGGNKRKNIQGNKIPSIPIVQETVDVRGKTIKVTNSSSPLNGFEMEISQGALPNATDITVNVAQVKASPTNATTVEIGPEGTIFAVDAHLSLKIDKAQIQKGDDPKDFMVVRESAGSVVEIDLHPTVDPINYVVNTTTSHLSKFTPVSVREYKLFDQKHRLFDGTPVRYAIAVTHTSITPPFVKTEKHPLLTDDASGPTIIPGKGTVKDFVNSSEGNVVYFPGLYGNPGDSLLDSNGQLNDNDILAELKKDPNIKNLLIFQYPSGWSVPYNAEAFVNLMIKSIAPHCRFVIIGHSMGGLLARYIIQKLQLSPYVDGIITLGTPHEGGMLQQLESYLTDTHIASLIFSGIVPGVSDVLAGGPLLNDLNASFPGNKLPTTEIFLVAGTLIDAQGNPTGNDGYVDLWSALSTLLGVPKNHTFVVAQNHGQLPHNARNNGVWIRVREWLYEIWGINKLNQPPTVNAGQDQTITVGATVTLAGAATDPEGDQVIATEWKQMSGPAVTLSNTATLDTSFPATQTGDYIFKLIAHDPDTRVQGEDTITITVNPLPPVVPGQQTFVPTYDTYHTTDAAYNQQNPNRDKYADLFAGDTQSGVDFWAEITFGTVTTTIPPNAIIDNATLELQPDPSVTPIGTRFNLTSGSSPIAVITATPLIKVDVTATVQSQVQQGGSCSFAIGWAAPLNYGAFYSNEDYLKRGPRLTITWH